MIVFRRFLRAFRALLRKPHLDADMDAEMRSHIEMRTQQSLDAGTDPEKARLAALQQFGWVESIKEDCRDQRGTAWLENLVQDIRFGARQLRKNPGFTTVAVLTLALGIGASTGMFTALNAILFRQPPYPKPEQLIQVTETQIKSRTSRETPPVNFLYWSRANTVFSGISAYAGAGDNGSALGETESFLTGAGQPVRLKCLKVLPGLFEMLGVSPMMGRTFTTDELYDFTVVILSYGCWQAQFASDPNIIGRSITLHGSSRRVIGVMPRGFFFPSKDFQVFWTPGISPGTFDTDKRAQLSVIARLRPGVSIQQARSKMEEISGQLARIDPDLNHDMGVRVESFHSFIAASSQPVLLLFLAVEVIFLIVCANLANLQLSRGASRGHEFNIRNALGASRARLFRQLITESLLLSALGGSLGFAMACIATGLVMHFIPDVIPPFAELRTDSSVVAFNAALTLLAPLVFGVVPAMLASKPASLGDRSESRSLAGGRFRELLISAEIALTVVLLIGAGLLVRTFLRLESADLGFRTEHTVTFRLISSTGGDEFGRGSQAFRDIENQLQSLPGVQVVGGSWSLPLIPLQDPSLVATIEGREGECLVLRGAVTRDYFRAMLTPLIDGRLFNDSDTPTSLRVALVNAAFAKSYFHGESAVGKRFRMGPLNDANEPWITVAGVVGDQKRAGIGKPVKPAVWMPVSQLTPPTLSFVVRGTANPKTLITDAQRVIQSSYKGVYLGDVATMDELVQGSLADRRFRTSLLCIFAVIALLLSAIGVYGVLAFSVAQRSVELGIRMALGAQRGDVPWLMLCQGMKPAVLGLGIGLSGALASSRMLKGLLYGVSAADPETFVAVPVLLTLVALLACWLPSRRAASGDPMVALRQG